MNRFRSFVAGLVVILGGLRAFPLGALALAAVLLASACGRSSVGAPAEGNKAASAPGEGKAAAAAQGGRAGAAKGPQGPVPILAATAERRSVPIYEKAVGTVEANATVQVRSQIDGVLTQVHFKKGQLVRQNDEIFSIDPRPFQAAVHKQEGVLAKDEAQARYTDADARRYDDLVRSSAASKEDAERARAAADSAAAQVDSDKADLESAKLQLEYCSIRAPFDGRVGDILIDAGNTVKADDLPLVTILQTRPIAVSFTLPESGLPSLLKAQSVAGVPLRVEALLPGDTGKPASGTLTFIDNQVDRQTGTIHLQATFANDDDRLWPGEFVNVTVFLGEQKDAVLVPSEAIQNGQDGHYVYIVQADNTVANRSVKPGRDVDGHTVVEEGLAEGERVVTDGHLRLKPGAAVEVKSSLDATAQAGVPASAPKTPASGIRGGKPQTPAAPTSATLARTNGR